MLLAAVPLARPLRRPAVIDEFTAAAREGTVLLELRPELRCEVCMTPLGASGAAVAFTDAKEKVLRKRARSAMRASPSGGGAAT